MARLRVAELQYNVKVNSQGFTDGMRRVQRELRRTAKQIEDIGKSLSMKITAPIAAISAISLKMAGDFEKGMNRVQALSGATSAEFERMEKQAMKLGATTRYTAGQAADGMGFMAMAGFEANQIISAMPSTLQLAAAANMDLAAAADITTNILTGYSMQVSELNRANDAMVKGFTRSNTSMEQMGHAMKYVAPVASGLKIQFEETVAAIGLLGNAGIQGSMAGTALRGALVRLQKPTGEVGAVIEKLGLEINDSTGKMRSMADIVEQLEKSGASTADMMALFGQRAGPGMMALVEQGSKALRDFTKELEGAGGTAARIAEVQTKGFAGAVLMLKSAFEGLMITIAKSGLLDWATKFANQITAIVSAMNEINPVFLKHATALALIAAAAGPVLLTGAAIIKMTQMSIGVYGALGKSVIGTAGTMGALTKATNINTVALTANSKAALAAQVANARYMKMMGGMPDVTTKAARSASMLSRATFGLVTSIGKLSLGPLLAIAAAYQGAKIAAEWLTKNAEEKFEADLKVGNELAKQNSAIVEQVANMSTALEKASALYDVQQRIASLEIEIAHATGDRKKELEASLRLMQVQQTRIEKYGDEILENNAEQKRLTSEINRIEERRNKILEDRNKWMAANSDKIKEEFEALQFEMLPDDKKLDALQKKIDKISWGYGAEEYLAEALRIADRIEDRSEREESILRAKQTYLEIQKIEEKRNDIKQRIADASEDESREAKRTREEREREAKAAAKILSDQIAAREAAVGEFRAMQLEAAGQGEAARYLRDELEIRSKIADEAERLGVSEQEAENLLRNQLALQREIAGVKETDRALTREERKAAKDAERERKRAEKRAAREAADPRIDLGDGQGKKRWSEMSSLEQDKARERFDQGYGADGKIRPEYAAQQAANQMLGIPTGSLTTQEPRGADTAMRSLNTSTPGVEAVQKQQKGADSGGGDGSIMGALNALVEAITNGNAQISTTIENAFPAN